MAKAIWGKYNIPKYSFTCWLTVHERLLTKDRLMSWNITVGNDKCVLCNQLPESIDHLFFKCLFSRALCEAIACWLKISSIPERKNEWQKWLIHLVGLKHIKGRIYISVVIAAIALIWKERKARVHGKNPHTVQHCLFKLKQEVITRVLGCVIGGDMQVVAQNVMHLN